MDFEGGPLADSSVFLSQPFTARAMLRVPSVPIDAISATVIFFFCVPLARLTESTTTPAREGLARHTDTCGCLHFRQVDNVLNKGRPVRCVPSTRDKKYAFLHLREAQLRWQSEASSWLRRQGRARRRRSGRRSTRGSCPATSWSACELPTSASAKRRRRKEDSVGCGAVDEDDR